MLERLVEHNFDGQFLSRFRLRSARHVHSNTPLLSDSPEATPSGKRSRRSRQKIFEGAGK